jgi:tRNA wybutosine-synthesizing protein 2
MVLTPIKKIRKSLKNKIPGEYIRKIPAKWERNGNILIIKLDKKLKKYDTVIGESYSDVLGCKTILNDIRGIKGEFRKPNVEVMYGSNNTETIHKENGIKFKLDPKKIMFSSGNMSERIFMSKVNCKNETIIDFFAGIGYFTLPLAVCCKPKKIFACEKNPVAFKYLKENIVLNHVTKIVEPLKGDNREITPENIADRIIMGYIGGTEKFFSKAIKCLRDKKGIIHFHEKYSEKKPLGDLAEKFEKKVKKFDREIKLIDIRNIKSYAPGISHFVFDFEIL